MVLNMFFGNDVDLIVVPSRMPRLSARLGAN